MSWTTLLLLLSPLILLILMFGLVVVVALLQARPEDIPTIWRDSTQVFRRLADQLPKVTPGDHVPKPATLEENPAGQEEEP